MDFMMAFDVILLALGGYLLYAANQMKRNQNIPNSIVPAHVMLTCKDVKGYADYLYPWIVAFAIACLAFGFVSVGLDTGVLQLGIIGSIINIVVVIGFLALWIAFSVVLRKGQKKFF